MSYQDRRTISDGLIELLHSSITQHKGKLNIIEYDVTLLAWTNGGRLMCAWCTVIIATGSLVGRDNWCSYKYVFENTPVPPTTEALENAVKESMTSIRGMQVRQLTAPQPNTNPQNN